MNVMSRLLSVRRSPPTAVSLQGGAAALARGGQRTRRSGGAHLQRPARKAERRRWRTVACVRAER